MTRWLVVGAGSAGCVAAARLSERGDHEVILLEAGPPLESGDVPPGIDGDDFFAAMGAPGRIHDGLTATLTSAAAPVPYVRGRGVGGSSAVNGLIALRGTPDSYRRWGWTDVDDAWRRVAVPEEAAAPDELGPVDRALRSADPAAVPVPLTRHDGRRVTSAEAYLWPARSRSNLVVRPESLVDRITFRAPTVHGAPRATGVRLADGAEIDADAVVVSAGAIHSPAILQRSGVAVSGLGERLLDHPSVVLTFRLHDGAAAGGHAAPSGPASAPAVSGGSGSDASVNGDHGLVAATAAMHGDVQFLPLNHFGGLPGTAGRGGLMIALMRPRGPGGTVRITTDDPTTHPRVVFDLLDVPEDVARLAAGVRMAVDVLRRPAFRDAVDDIVIDTAGTSVEALDDDVRLERWLRASVGDYVHATSTCAMGAVVDDDGLVVGYRGLYVCDASVFPWIPDANTHLPTTMVADRLVARWMR